MGLGMWSLSSSGSRRSGETGQSQRSKDTGMLTMTLYVRMGEVASMQLNLTRAEHIVHR